LSRFCTDLADKQVWPIPTCCESSQNTLVQVGDQCRFGDEIGFVEEIGLRSTRIRKHEDSIVSVPNAKFSQLQLENLSRRKKILFRVILSLRYETISEQLRFVLARLREMLIGHPKMSPKNLRVRFRRFGDYYLNIEVFAYVRTSDRYKYWAIREDLNLRIIDIVKDAGTDFAFPSQTAYLTRDSGLDGEKSQEAGAQIKDWRNKNKLPFPEFDQADQMKLKDSRKYPPAGSADYSRKSTPPEKRQHSKAAENDTKSKDDG